MSHWLASSWQITSGLRVGRSLDHRLEHGTQLADQARILAFEPEVGRVHLDELANEDSRAGVVFVLVTAGVRQRGPNEVIHELEFPAYRDAQPG